MNIGQTNKLAVSDYNTIGGGVNRVVGMDRTPDGGKVSSIDNTTANQNKLVPADQRLDTLEEMFDEKTLKRMGAIECATCASRTYQDGSDDSSVSFQAPTNLSPAQAESAVIAHEMEHVSNEQQYAEEEGRQVTGQSVQIFRDVCPECGRSYVSGGLTRTTTVGKREDAYGQGKGKNSEMGNLLDISL